MNKGQQNLLQFINEVSFALDDVALYLDTHPKDMTAMEYYRKYKSERAQAIKEYENMYGPLCHYNVNQDTWTWVDEPWPWEGV